jgi:predicted DNA-binding transcriptional regulator AlpA
MPKIESQAMLLRAAAAAAFIGISTRQFWRLLSAESLPGPIRLGASRFWRRRDLERWIDQGCLPPDRGDHAG